MKKINRHLVPGINGTRTFDCRSILRPEQAELGAEVIKIETPDGGDPLRQWRVLKDGDPIVVVGAGAEQKACR